MSSTLLYLVIKQYSIWDLIHIPVAVVDADKDVDD